MIKTPFNDQDMEDHSMDDCLLSHLCQPGDGIPPHQQRLIFDYQQLEEGHTPAYYNIHNDSTVLLILRLTGY